MQTIERRILITIFGVTIFAMLAFSLRSWSSDMLAEEKRIAAPVPRFVWNVDEMLEFPQGFDRFFNDRLAFRSALVCCRNYLKLRLFGVSANPQVVVGTDDWLFNRGYQDSNNFHDVKPLSNQELAEITEVLEERSRMLAGKGIKFLVVVPPEKGQVYPECLPKSLRLPGRTSRMDQLAEYLRKNSSVDFVYLKDDLIANKWRGNLYRKLDTHWNALGGFIGYQTVMRKLQHWRPDLKPRELSDFDVRFGQSRPAELDTAHLLGLGSLVTETNPRLKPKHARCAVFLPDPPKPDFTNPVTMLNPFAKSNQDPRSPRALMLRDSFAWELVPHLSEHFSHIAYYYQYDLTNEMIERHKPDIVIQEVLAPYLLNHGINSWLPSEAVQSKFTKSKTVYSASSKQTMQESWKLYQGWLDDGKDYKVVNSNADPSLILPAFKCNPDRSKQVRIDMSAPETCFVQMFFQTEKNWDYNERNSVLVRTPAGRAIVWMQLPAEVRGQLRLDPMNKAGSVTIHSLEIRE